MHKISLSSLVLFIPPMIAVGQEAEVGKLIFVQKGNLPIILSAPHGGRNGIPNVPERAGIGVQKFTKVRDENTAELTRKVNAEVERVLKGKPYVIVAHFDRKFLDANRPSDGAYESLKAKPYYDAYHKALNEACREVQKKFGKGLLLDIHGQATYQDAVVRGTNNGKTVTLLLQRNGLPALTGPSSILGRLEKAGYKQIPPLDSKDKEDPKYGGGYIVQTYGSHTGQGIDALQLELGGNFRKTKVLDRTAKDLAEAVGVFARKYLAEDK